MSNENDEYKKIINDLELDHKIHEEELKDRDKLIKELQHKIFDLETKIEIFQKQIAPGVAETIKNYRNTIINFESIIPERDKTIQDLKERNKALEIKKIELIKQTNENQKLSKEINEVKGYLPIICETLMNEIDERNKEIHLLTEENILFKQKLDNTVKVDDSKEFKNNLDRIQELIKEIDDKTKKIEFLKMQINEQKKLISKLKIA